MISPRDVRNIEIRFLCIRCSTVVEQSIPNYGPGGFMVDTTVFCPTCEGKQDRLPKTASGFRVILVEDR